MLEREWGARRVLEKESEWGDWKRTRIDRRVNLSERELKRELERDRERFSDKEKLQGERGRWAQWRQERRNLSPLFNLVQTHQNSCQSVCHSLTLPPVLGLCLSFWIHFSCFCALNDHFIAIFCSVECVYSTKKQGRETERPKSITLCCQVDHQDIL